MKEWWLKNHAHLLLVCQSVLFQGEKWIEKDRKRKTRGLSSANASKVPIISKYEKRCDKTISFFNWGKWKIKNTGEYFFERGFSIGTWKYFSRILISEYCVNWRDFLEKITESLVLFIYFWFSLDYNREDIFLVFGVPYTAIFLYKTDSRRKGYTFYKADF